MKNNSEIDKMVNDVKVELVKIIGTLNGTEEKIEMLMDTSVFQEWKDMLVLKEREKIIKMIKRKFDTATTSIMGCEWYEAQARSLVFEIENSVLSTKGETQGDKE